MRRAPPQTHTVFIDNWHLEGTVFKHILVCTDGSRLSDKAVNAAIRLAGDCNAKLTAFHATQDYPVNVSGEYALVAGSVTPRKWKEDQEQRALHILGKVQTRSRKEGIECTIRHGAHAETYRAIIGAASKGRCDLIVMASHGRRGIRGLVMGSETNKVLTHSKVPVLVYR